MEAFKMGIFDELEFPGEGVVFLFADTCTEESHFIKWSSIFLIFS